MVIAHNLSAMNSQRQYGITNLSQAKSTEKLSSGYRINRAADDAAGLAISEKMRRQIRGLTQGVSNTQDGVSMNQVADGALAEVQDMLHRMTELSVKAANGTLAVEDRNAINQEINEIVKEINRIGDTTAFNEQLIFKGAEVEVLGPDGNPLTNGDIKYGDITIEDLSLTNSPFNNSSQGDAFSLGAKVDKTGVITKTYNLVFGSGSTSHSKVRITTAGGEKIEFDVTNLHSASSPTFDSVNKTWTRELVLEKDGTKYATLKQVIGTEEAADGSKNYKISNSIKNETSDPITADYLFVVDTAYNNNDRNDAYYANGTYLDKNKVYGKATSTVGAIGTNTSVDRSIPNSMSIVALDGTLSFTEKFDWTGADPDFVAVGNYNDIAAFTYYDDARLTSEAKVSTKQSPTKSTDLGIAIGWDNVALAASAEQKFDLKIGVANLETDPNLAGANVEVDEDTPWTVHDRDMKVWIQSGSEKDQGLWIKFGELNDAVLGLRGQDVTTQARAGQLLTATKGALKYVSSMRSDIGAQQNRLEHIIANESNVVENTSAAESLIRDTDMATEMVRFSNNNILLQAGTAMMAQANQTNQSVLSLLQ